MLFDCMREHRLAPGLRRRFVLRLITLLCVGNVACERCSFSSRLQLDEADGVGVRKAIVYVISTIAAGHIGDNR
jgi:hypothetical protein